MNAKVGSAHFEKNAVLLHFCGVGVTKALSNRMQERNDQVKKFSHKNVNVLTYHQNMGAVALHAMIEQLLIYIAQYGHLAILALIFLQEVGVPSPIPNELVLLFSGYLSYTGVLKASLVILAAMVGDLLASFILFELFYFFGKSMMDRKPKWLPISEEKLKKLKLKIDTSGEIGTYIGRVTPFIKGYVSVLCGLIKISQKKYSIVLVTTSLALALVYVGCGYIVGPYLKDVTVLTEQHLYLLPVGAVLIILLFQFFKKKTVV